jgi:uncharacterized membrane protein YccC
MLSRISLQDIQELRQRLEEQQLREEGQYCIPTAERSSKAIERQNGTRTKKMSKIKKKKKKKCQK